MGWASWDTGKLDFADGRYVVAIRYSAAPNADGFGARASDLHEHPLLDPLALGAASAPDKVLVVSEESSMTYGEAHLLTRALIRFLSFEIGLAHLDTIIVYLANRLEVPSIVVAADALGLRVVMRPPYALGECIADNAILAPSLIFVADVDARAVLETNGISIPIVTLEESDDSNLSLHSILEAFADEKGALPGFAPSEVVLFSSGSTGLPKGIVNPMSSFLHNALELASALGINAGDVLYAPVPVFHVYGFVSMTVALLHGATWAILERYSTDRSLELIEKERPTVFFCVPTMLIREMKRDETVPHRIDSLRVCMVAGDGCPRSALEKYERRYGCSVVLSYGMTETAATLTVENPSASSELRHSSVGHAISGVELTIDSATGEILVRTPSLMSSLINYETGEERAINRTDWFMTGDIGRIDDCGRLHVLGRMKSVIVRGGLNIFPSQVERVYREHPCIEDCAVAGYPDAELGECICLIAVCPKGGGVSLEELREWAKDKLERGMLPEKLVVLDELPCLSNGKRDVERLRAIARDN